MRVLVAGGDGFCGWLTALYLRLVSVASDDQDRPYPEILDLKVSWRQPRYT